LITQLEGVTKDGSCLAQLDQLATGSWEWLADHHLMSLMKLFEQIATACHARAADVAAYLIERAIGEGLDQRSMISLTAVATGCTEGEVKNLVEVGQGRQVSDRFKQALDSGKTTMAGAKAIANETNQLAPAAAAEVFEEVLTDPAVTNSNKQRQAARQAVERNNPQTRQTRHANARKRRRVVLEPAANGMSWLKGYIPSLNANIIYQKLRRATENAALQGRTVRQAEADLFAQYLLGDNPTPTQTAEPTTDPNGGPTSEPETKPTAKPTTGPAPGPTNRPTASSNGQPQVPTTAGTAPRPSSGASKMVPKPDGAAARHARVLFMVDPQALDAAMERPVPNEPPGTLTSEIISGSRVLVNINPQSLTAENGSSACPPGTEPAAGGKKGRLSTALDPPGVVAAPLVGSLSMLDSDELTWLVRHAYRQAIVTHPESGRLVTLGARPARPGSRLVAPKVNWHWHDPTTWPSETAASPTYQPADWLTLLVMIRDQTCRWPGCARPATECQIDHHQAFSFFRAPETQTLASNLGCLCLLHHRMKHQDHWTAQRDPATGITTWTHRSGLTTEVPPSSLSCGNAPP